MCRYIVLFIYLFLIGQINLFCQFPIKLKPIIFSNKPIQIETSAYAGEDQLNLEGPYTKLNANYPVRGYGKWTVLSGKDYNFVNNFNPKTVFSGKYGNTYILRWTITNVKRTTYDDVTISFIEFKCGNNLVDNRDGKKYKTKLFGNQCWMLDNFNFGVFIKSKYTGLNHSDVSLNRSIEKYCYDNNEINCDLYGGLYDWNEIMNYTNKEKNQGICPDGWYIPSDNDWKTLEIFLGMEPNVCDERGWRGDNSNKFFEVGFLQINNSYPGKRNTKGDFSMLNIYQIFWNSTETDNLYGWYRNFQNTRIDIGREDTDKTFGISLRCIKDN